MLLAISFLFYSELDFGIVSSPSVQQSAFSSGYLSVDTTQNVFSPLLNFRRHCFDYIYLSDFFQFDSASIRTTAPSGKINSLQKTKQNKTFPFT